MNRAIEQTNVPRQSFWNWLGAKIRVTPMSRAQVIPHALDKDGLCIHCASNDETGSCPMRISADW